MNAPLTTDLRTVAAEGTLPAKEALTSDTVSMWSRDEAFDLCRLLEGITPAFGAHVALTGGLLYKDGPRKDCDVLLYRIRERAEPVDYAGLFGALMEQGFEVVGDWGWCKKLIYQGKRIDMFDPEDDGEYPAPEEVDPDLAMEAARDDEHLLEAFVP